MAKKKTKAKSRAAAKPARRPASRMKARPAKKAVLKAKAQPARKAAAKAPAPQPARSKALATGSQWINPMLVVRNMKAAIDFYVGAFGFKLRGSFPGPDGKLMHAELLHQDSVLMLGPENQQMGSFAPQGPSPVTLYIYAENVDAVVQRAAGLGGKIMMPVADMFWGDRCGVIVDPEGHNWMIATHIKDMTPEEMIEAMKAMMASQPPPPVM